MSSSGAQEVARIYRPQNRYLNRALVGDYREFCVDACIGVMPSKRIELLAKIARAFVREMREFFAVGHNTINADEIAARQLHALRGHQGPREKRSSSPMSKKCFCR
jgi:hypothetical protein